MGFKDDMLAMGFNENRAERSLRAVQYSSLERAVAWLEAHENDPDIDDPLPPSQGHVLGSADQEVPALASENSDLEQPVALTDEEKAQKAEALKAKIAERKKIADAKDREDAILREKIRRKEGQSLAEMREQRQQDEVRKMAEERRRQKLEDERAKKAVLQKIKEDRAKQEKERNAMKEECKDTFVTPVQTKAPQNYNECRLQIRLPTGKAITNTFKAEDTLGDVVAFIRDSTDLDNFHLMTSFPTKVFQVSEYGFSLKSIGLCPTSVLMTTIKKPVQ